jgi:hypothetical protein
MYVCMYVYTVCTITVAILIIVIVNIIIYKNAISKGGYEAQSITQDLLSW